MVASRDKDVTIRLCQEYGIPQVVLSQVYTGSFFSGVWEILKRTLGSLRLALKFKPDALIGTSMTIGVVGKIIRRPSFVFCEDDADVVPLISKFVYPTCTYVVTPECLRHEDYGKKHLTYPGYHELAYLHPDHFVADPEVLRSIGLTPDSPYFIIRSVTLKAMHDHNARGLPAEITRELIRMLSARGRVLITSEGELSDPFKAYQFPLPPEKLLDVLAFAAMYIGDSQTVTAEAAMLGVPSLRCNTFVGRISYLSELEDRYGLTRGFTPDQGEELLATVREWLTDIGSLRQEMQRRRMKMLEERVNVSKWQWQMLCEKLSLYWQKSEECKQNRTR